MINMKSLITGILLIAGCLSIWAQKPKDVTGRHEYHLPRHQSRAQGEQVAMERAIIEALAREFGTFVRQETQMNFSSSEEGENSEFYSSASTLVRGEWLETIGQPKLDIYLTQDGEIVLTCEIKGKAREIRRVVDDFDAKVLKGGTTDNFQTSHFIHGDKIYLAFTAPQDGFVAVYLEDEDNNFMRMLPFNGEGKNARGVKGNRRYVFFTSDEGLETTYLMRTEKHAERNTIHVIYSPHPFVLSVDQAAEDEESLDFLSGSQFRKWIDKSGTLDPDMQHQKLFITIVERQD